MSNSLQFDIMVLLSIDQSGLYLEKSLGVGGARHNVGIHACFVSTACKVYL